ncbi:MAG: hypothetical protein JNG86_03315 [Verrucomicrobiaceae bacterium]|nr:hypothetical protein [Verrucomicrobiaceae bacterium]
MNPSRASHPRWFYSIASILMLIITFTGFQLFYLEGKAFPGRPLTPPIRPLLITHGVLMTVWMLLAVAQPILVAAGRKRLHMTLGRLGAVLAVGIVVTGWRLGVAAARLTPPEMRFFGLTPKEFMAVPVAGVVVFGLFVLAGVILRRRPDAHRPMMLMASLSAVAAALGRFPSLNALYAGSMWEQVFTAFFTMVALGAVFLIVKCLLARAFDRWFALAFACLAASSVVISLGCKTSAWDSFASFLLR